MWNQQFEGEPSKFALVRSTSVRSSLERSAPLKSAPRKSHLR